MASSYVGLVSRFQRSGDGLAERSGFELGHREHAGIARSTGRLAQARRSFPTQYRARVCYIRLLQIDP